MSDASQVQQRRDAIEQLIDIHTLEVVLGDLIDVCGAKAEHLRVNWQDDRSAAAWDAMADRLSTAAARACRLRI